MEIKSNESGEKWVVLCCAKKDPACADKDIDNREAMRLTGLKLSQISHVFCKLCLAVIEAEMDAEDALLKK